MITRPRLQPQSIRHLLRSRQHYAHRTITSAPRPGGAPLMERRADRALPTLSTPNRWLRTFPIFAAMIIGSTLAIFNYQKSSSSVVSSTLYALRTNAEARQILGDEIYFANQIPWIGGELNQLHGRIDISFWVKGTRGRGLMRFKSVRKTRMGNFETLEWSLKPEGGETISLLQVEGRDPFIQETADKITVME